MLSKLIPCLYTARATAIDPAFLLSHDLHGLILDIDNTLVTYDDPEPTPEVAAWFSRMTEAGIRIALVSNNNAARVERFNAQWGFFATAKSGKPGKKSVLRALEALQLPKEQVAMMGDQVFTDVYAGNKCGLFTILVPPIKDKRDPFTRFKRLGERPVLRAYRKRQAKKEPMKLAVLGSPIAHSRSPLLHQTLSRLCHVPVTYEAMETDQSTLAKRVADLISQGYDGWNCTMPLKTDMTGMVEQASDASHRLTSVNTVLPFADGSLYGATTDGGGILETLRHHGIDCRGKRVLMIGAGGAARSIADAVVQAGGILSVLNRTEKDFDGIHAHALTKESLQNACRDCDVLIQASSLGMEGNADFEDLSFVDCLPAHAAVVDAVYHPLCTSLLQRAEARGLLAIDGLWMLMYQGILSFALWTGVIPDRQTAQAIHQILTDSFTKTQGA